MKIFLSWSKSKSKEISLAVKSFLEGMFRNSVTIWMSSESITYGSMFLNEIGNALKESDKCFAIITSENYTAPWIMYEAGAIAIRNYHKSNSNAKNAVIPILFDEIEDNKFRGNPLDQFQRLIFNRNNLNKLVKEINDNTNAFPNSDTLETQFNLNWNLLSESVNNILKSHTINSNSPVTCDFLLNALEKVNFPTPDCGPVIRYESGFETQKLYEVLLENADKRLWLFGRKNRKLFSTENREFFKNLNRKRNNGFDFRCLFISPVNNPSIERAQGGGNFKSKLEVCINEAKNQLSYSGINFNDVCRFYTCERTDEIIIIDNVVLYSHITYADDNYPNPLTKADFYVLDIESPIGRRYCGKFEAVWNSSKSIELNI